MLIVLTIWFLIALIFSILVGGIIHFGREGHDDKY